MWTMIWVVVMSASATLSLYWMRSGILDEPEQRLIGVFALGALIGFPVGRYVLTFVPDQWKTNQRFAAAFIILGASTTGFTALFVAFDFLNYYSQWHDDHLSKRRFFETVTTILSAFYQFLVLGMRHFLPVGFLALGAVSAAFASRRL